MPRSNEPHDERHHEARGKSQGESQTDAPAAAGLPSCDDVLDRLELYLDGLDGTDGTEEGLPGLGEEETAAVENHVTRCPVCARELSRARTVRDGLRSLPEVPHAPKTPEEGEPASGNPLGPRLRWAIPVAAAAVPALAVLVLAVLSALPERTGDPGPPTTAAVEKMGPEVSAPDVAAPDVSAEELARAELEARYALARLAEATRRARREIREDVLARHLVAPVQRELLRSFQAPPEIDPETADPRPASL